MERMVTRTNGDLAIGVIHFISASSYSYLFRTSRGGRGLISTSYILTVIYSSSKLVFCLLAYENILRRPASEPLLNSFTFCGRILAMNTPSKV